MAFAGARTAIHVIALTGVLAVPAYEDVAKYARHDHPVVVGAVGTVALGVVVTVALRLLEHPRFRAVAAAWPVTALLLLAITGGSFALRRAELHRFAIGLGSTAAPALTQPGQALVHGHSLYAPQLTQHVPISPGPLWLIANVPFSFPHLFPLLLPFWLAVIVAVLRWAMRRPAEVTVGLVLLCCSSHFWVMLTQGQDLLVTAGLMVAAVAAAHRVTEHGPCSDVVAALLGIALGVVATSRFIYLPFPLLCGWFMARRPGTLRPAIIAAFVGLGVAGGANLVASVGVHPYPPVHLFGRAHQREPVWNIVLGAACTAVAVIATWRRTGPGVRSWLVGLAGCLAVPQLFISLGELEGLHLHLASWEASNYLFTAAPAVTAAVLATAACPSARRPAHRRGPLPSSAALS